MLNRKKGRNLIEKGFTLVELMIVIVIVGILSSVALPNFLSQTEKAKATEALTGASAATKTITAVYLQDPAILDDADTGLDAKVKDGGLCPDDTTDFTNECTHTNGAVTITGTILKGSLKDSIIKTDFDAKIGGKPDICSNNAKTGLTLCA